MNTPQQSDSHVIDDRYNFHDASFRRDYRLNHADGSHTYEEIYAPAYRYGYELAEQGKDWESAQIEAERHWSSMHTTPWSQVAEAIRYGWEEQRRPEEHRVYHQEGFAEQRSLFMEHHQGLEQQPDGAFEQYEPAYAYGYSLALDPQYNTRTWTDLEPQLREQWENDHKEQMGWDEYHNAAHYAWTETLKMPSAGV